MKVKVKKLHEHAKVPEFKTLGAAGCDLYSVEETIIKSGELVYIKTGLAFEIPQGAFGMVLPRSSFCFKFNLDMPHSAGVIDSDYRGEVLVVFRNLGKEDVKIDKHERVAQFIFFSYSSPSFEEVDELNETDRGTGGFGSTGKF
jgi:dUTP pyrophosphatase